MHELINEAASQIWAFVCKSAFVIFVALTSATMSVLFQIHSGKMPLSKGKIFAAISLSFIFAVLVSTIWSNIYGPKFEGAIAASTALIGRDLMTWLFANFDPILKGIAGKFNIKIKDK